VTAPAWSESAWLLDHAKKEPARAFHMGEERPVAACKLCDEQVPRDGYGRHLEEHRRELARGRRSARKEQARHLRRLSRLRAETRTAAPADAAPFTLFTEGDDAA
jgi:hypothetical protein